MKTRDIARLGLLAAAALVLGYIESLIPIAPGIPGIKLGIANTVLLYAVYTMKAPYAWALMAVKVVLSGFLYAGVSAMLYSFSGGILSLAVMLLIKKIRGVTAAGVSVAGACAHNLGQLLAAALAVGLRPALSLAPVLTVSAVVAGLATGIAAKYVLKVLEKNAHL